MRRSGNKKKRKQGKEESEVKTLAKNVIEGATYTIAQFNNINNVANVNFLTSEQPGVTFWPHYTEKGGPA